ncbi:hypothetical protein ACFQ5M_08985 [Agrilactobacillus yilanensis]|uniref:Bacteriocin immunity protein n=1 Tax=Agrilactobacillus yilanensis TaxID=2485997 RepID=A0ABW4J889_9LACO|nr:hypothetical protein [Agrilactobacillus yilanensis]
MKKEKEARKEAIIDMVEFLIKYGNQKLPTQKDLVKTIYQTAHRSLDELDILFQDNGYGRNENFLDVAKGFLVDYYGLAPEATEEKAVALGQEAISYLGKHLDDFIKWER